MQEAYTEPYKRGTIAPVTRSPLTIRSADGKVSCILSPGDAIYSAVLNLLRPETRFFLERAHSGKVVVPFGVLDTSKQECTFADLKPRYPRDEP